MNDSGAAAGRVSPLRRFVLDVPCAGILGPPMPNLCLRARTADEVIDASVDRVPGLPALLHRLPRWQSLPRVDRIDRVGRADRVGPRVLAA